MVGGPKKSTDENSQRPISGSDLLQHMQVPGDLTPDETTTA